MNKLTFDINNGLTLAFEQDTHDRLVKVHKYDGGGKLVDADSIPAGQFVMMWNMYKYIMENDIKNDFINPYGKNREEE